MILPMSNGCIFLSKPCFALYVLLLRQFYSFLLVCFLLGREMRIPVSVINMQLHCKLSPRGFNKQFHFLVPSLLGWLWELYEA